MIPTRGGIVQAPPERLSPEAFTSHVQREWEERYEKVGDKLICRTCLTPVVFVTCYASLPATEFGDQCAGHGEVKRVNLPFCPKCEQVPETLSTCIHLPLGETLKLDLS